MSLEEIPDDFEISLIGFFIKTRKWLRIGFYKPPSQSDKYFLDNLSFILNKLTCQHYNTMLMRDFNLIVENKKLGVFINTKDII